MDEKKYTEAIANGDDRVFDLIFMKYQPRLVCFFAGFIGDQLIAEDLAQDLFFNLWKNRRKLDGVRSLEQYIFRMARNAVNNHYDHSLVKQKYVAEMILNQPVNDDPDEVLFVKDLQELFMLRVEGLSPQRRQVFLMSRVEGLDNGEIAERLGISKRTVENHLTAVLAELRKILQTVLVIFLS